MATIGGTTQQVSRSQKNLSQAIQDGDIPQPELMNWNTWQIWRSEVGQRPTAAADGEATNTTFEVALWKSIMGELYGDNWSVTLAASGAPTPGVSPPPSAPRLQLKPRLI